MKNKILLVVSILYGALMVNAGLNKLFKFFPMPEDAPRAMQDMMAAFESTGWLMPLLGVAEVIGGILLAIPRTRMVGALVLLPISIGILCSHIVGEPAGIPLALVFLAVNAWVLIDGRHRLMPLVAR